MAFNFTFRSMESQRDLTMLIDFLMKQHLEYPNYEDWVQRAEHELETSYKTAILAFSNGHLVGDVIYQPHKELLRVRELKNMRIHPDVRRRYFAHFMLKQAEVEKKDEYDAIICDLHADQPAMINLLHLFGYVSLTITPLYDKNMPDMVMIKYFDQTTKSGILHRAQGVILGKN